MILLPLKLKQPISDGPDLAPYERSSDVRRSQRFGRVLDQQHAVALARLANRRQIRRQTDNVRSQHGCGHPRSASRASVQLIHDEGRRDVPCRLICVNQNRACADIRNRVDGSDERKVGYQHLVARLDPGDSHRDVQCRRAVRTRHGVAATDVRCKLGLEP